MRTEGFLSLSLSLSLYCWPCGVSSVHFSFLDSVHEFEGGWVLRLPSPASSMSPRDPALGDAPSLVELDGRAAEDAKGRGDATPPYTLPDTSGHGSTSTSSSPVHGIDDREPMLSGCAYCCVLYGDNAEYLLLLLVLAYRLALLGARYPLLVLPTEDVPALACAALRRAGCHLLPPIDYLRGHPALFAQSTGRHRNVLTKLRVLGLAGLSKVLLIDADVLPRQNLDPLFELEPPAAMLMPTNLEWVTPLKAGSSVPTDWLRVDAHSGRGARVNCGVCLLAPDPELLAEIEKEVDPARSFSITDNGVVHNVFGQAWCQSWTPEEDALTRALSARGAKWTHIGCAFNFEVQSDTEYYNYERLPIALEHANLDFMRDAMAFHFVGKRKPSWHAWFVGLGQRSATEVQENIRADKAAGDPREIVANAFREWFAAFEELIAHAAAVWGLDIMAACGWRPDSMNTILSPVNDDKEEVKEQRKRKYGEP